MLAACLVLQTTGLVLPSAVNAPALRGAAAPSRTAAIEMKPKISKKLVWVSFADKSEVKPDSIISGFRYGQELAIICEKGGALFATSNKIPPTSQPATFCTLTNKGSMIEPVSGTEFNLKTGKVMGTWCPAPVGQLILKRLIPPQDCLMFPVRRQGNAVQVLIDVNAKAAFEANYWRGVLDSQGKVDGGYY